MRNFGTAALLAGTLFANEARAEESAEDLAMAQMNKALDAGNADEAFAYCNTDLSDASESVDALCDLIRENYVLLEDYSNDGKRNTSKDALQSNGIMALQAAGWYSTIARDGALGFDRVTANYNHINDLFHERGDENALVAKAILQSHKMVDDPNGGVKPGSELEDGYSYFYEGIEHPLFCEQNDALNIEVCRTEPLGLEVSAPENYERPQWTFAAGPSYSIALEDDAYGEIDDTGAGVNLSARYMPSHFGGQVFLQSQLDRSAEIDGLLDRFGLMGVYEYALTSQLGLEAAAGPAVNASRMYANELGARALAGFRAGLPLADRLLVFKGAVYVDMFRDSSGFHADQLGFIGQMQVPVEWRD